MTAAVPFRTEPLFVEKTWGAGERLRSRLGLDAPDSTGEVWLISDVAGAPTRVLDGPWRGLTLREVMEREPQALAGPQAQAGDRFPLLVKFLELGGPLSVQVHPDAPTAAALGDGAQGKCESWLILDVGPEGSVSVGLEDGFDPAQLPTLGVREDFPERLHRYRPEPGEAIEILPGTFHTAHDLLLLEVQETCDTTYRVFDFGRGREVHLAQAQACLERIPRPRPPRQQPLSVPGSQAITTASPFHFEQVRLAAGARQGLPGPGPWVVVVFDGVAELQTADGVVSLRPGQAGVVPACAAEAALEASANAAFGWARPLGSLG